MIGIVILFISLNYGVLGISLGILIGGVFNCIINAMSACKLVEHSVLTEMKELLPTVTICILMGLIVYSVRIIGVQNDLLLLAIQILIGAVAYLILSRITKNRSYQYLVRVIEDRLKKRM